MAKKQLPFLRVNKQDIVDDSGKPVRLRGVALGGWLMMEGYMMCGRGISEKEFKANLEKSAGKEALDDFTRSFRDTFIRESDIELIKEMGANCIRVPFNYRLVEFENRAYSLNEDGLKYLDRVVEWCEEHSLYCILDMHAAPGAQNPDWHSDCVGKHEFFTDTFNQDRYLRLWHFLAGRYKDSSAVAGYDVLNEPIVSFGQEGLVKNIYERVTKEIRDVDTKHIIFLEGVDWGQKISFLGKPADKNTAYSVHLYAPADFTFNWIVGLQYPGKAYGIKWNKATLEMFAKQYKNFIDNNEVPLYVGEFGVNNRDGFYGEFEWVKEMIYLFEKYHFHWTYWTYKTIANSVFPDGIYRYLENPSWICRKGPLTGWENFYTLWTKERSDIIESWKTKHFERSEKLYSILTGHLK